MTTKSLFKKREVWSHRDSRMVLELRDKGLTMREIAEKLKCSTTYVQKAIKGEI